MWFEILPSVGIIFTAMTLGMAGTFFFPKVILGRPSMRRLENNGDYHSYQRDQRLSGSAYKFQGLEAIPDGDEMKK